jgi:RimJ/RimL family protein N-acetyltransferase
VKVEGLILSLCWGTKVGYQAAKLQMKSVGSKEAEPVVVVTTERLVLRRWRRSDRQPFARLNADPRVMEFMPALLSPVESDLLVDRINAHFLQHGFGLCAVELRLAHSFIGFIGLAIPSFQAKFTPCVELGWRLAAEYWGQGLATEGSQQMVRYAFEVLGLEALVSFTVPANVRSRRVMEKLGMARNPADDFDHPNLPEGHPLRRHVLYRLLRSQWTPLPKVQTTPRDRSA